MQWKHYEEQMTGLIAAKIGFTMHYCHCEIGVITTGRQRVFSRYYVRVRLPNGTTECGEDHDGPVQALRRLNDLLKSCGVRLLAAGLDPRFYESGLSSQTSWGYLEGEHRAYHMIEAPGERTL